MKTAPVPFYPLRIKIGTLVLLLTAVAFGGFALFMQSVKPYQLMFPVLLIEALLTMKWAAPLIPWKQVVLSVLAVFAIHFAAEHFMPLLIVAEKAIEAVCVLGFGAFWVRRGYIPLSANRW